MTAVVSPMAYGSAVIIGGALCAGLCVGARRSHGNWRDVAAWLVGAALMLVAVIWVVSLAVEPRWSGKTSLPLPLCDAALVLAAVACWTRRPLFVELTWFWGMAGTLQAIVTPDLSVRFPHLAFFLYVAGHLGVVVAALYLVVGLGITPRSGAVGRTFAVTVAYTAIVGLVDGVTGANYMFLREPPHNWTLLRALGPWPWYLLSAAGVALVLLIALDAPFWRVRREIALNR